MAIVYRHYPIMGFGIEPARAAVCAKRQGRFEALYDAYVAQNDSLKPRESSSGKSWTSFAMDARVRDIPAFKACMNEEGIPDEIATDRSQAKRLGVGGVPVILVNETMIDGDPGAAILADFVLRAVDQSQLSRRQ